MIDDFYKILNLKPEASLYKIALHYKKHAKKILLLPNDTANSKADFYQINSAFEVLKNEQVRMYYDILYKILIQKQQTNISDQSIEKYILIIDNYILKGKEKADKIINNEFYILTISIKRSLVLSFLIGTIKLYMNYPGFIASPLAGVCFLIIGIIVFIRDISGISSDLWFIGLIFIITGIISIYVNYRYFTIDLMNKE